MIEVRADSIYSNLAIGSKMNDFSLKGVDDKHYSLKDFVGKNVLVIVFISNTSRHSQAYDSRLILMQSKFESVGAQLVAINSNDNAYSSYERFFAMVESSRKKGYNFPYLKDRDQRVAHIFDAVCTPEAFVFDRDRILRYRGKIDDNWSNPHAVKNNYVFRAVKELLAGKNVSFSESTPIGDSIKWHY